MQYLRSLAAKRKRMKGELGEAISKKDEPKVLAIHMRVMMRAEKLKKDLKSAVNGDSEPIKRELKRLSDAKKLIEKSIVRDWEIRYLQNLAAEKRIIYRDEEYCVFGIYEKVVRYKGKLDEMLEGTMDDEYRMTEGRLADAKHLSETIAICGIEKMIIGYARFVPHPASLQFEELVQEGKIAVVEKAMPRFDRHRGNKFHTYAMWWVRQAIDRYIVDKATEIRIPVHMFDRARMIRKFSKSYFNETGRMPTVEELAALTGLKEKAIDKILSMRDPVSINARVGDEGDGSELGELIEDTTVANQFDVASDGEMKDLVHRLLANLNTRLEMLVRKKFGIGGDEQTLAEIGKEERCSKENVRQLIAKALRRMHSSGRLVLREYYEDESPRPE